MHFVQRRGRGGLRRQRVDHHAVLVDVRVDGGDLALPEGAVQRTVDGADRDAQARGLGAVDLDVLAQAGVVDVGADIAQLRVLLQRRLQLGQPFLQRGQIVALQRDAVLRALAVATTIIAGQVLDRAQAQLQVRVAVGLRTQPCQCVCGGFAAAFLARLQFDVELRAGALAATAQAYAHGLHRRVGHQHVGDATLAADHVLEGHRRTGVGAAPDQAGVLRRERPLLHRTEQEDGDADQDQRRQRQQQRMAQREIKEHGVDTQHPLVTGIEPAAEARRCSFVVVRAEEAAAQRRGQRQRNDHRHHDRRHQGHGELAEERAHHAAGEQQRDEHRHQRGGDRYDGEADFARTGEGRLHPRHALVEVAHDVLDHHDRVVDHEADRDHQRQQAQVVQGEAHHVHHQRGTGQ
ncbi:hypothetical protein D3C73_718120 [compost metagenome]